jgi:hypothetical protein
VEHCILETKEELENQINGNSKITSFNDKYNHENHTINKEIPCSKNLAELMKESKLTNIVTKDKLIKVPVSNINNGVFNCACRAVEFHDPFYENTNCLTSVFTLNNIERGINISKLPAVILDDRNYEKFFDPLFKIVTSLFENNQAENNYKSETNNFYESKVFISSIQLLEAVSEYYTKSFNPYLNHEGKFSIFKYFTFDYIIKVFENTDRSPQVTYLKADLLKFFRNFTLKPIIKYKNMAYIDDLLTPAFCIE